MDPGFESDGNEPRGDRMGNPGGDSARSVQNPPFRKLQVRARRHIPLPWVYGQLRGVLILKTSTSMKYLNFCYMNNIHVWWIVLKWIPNSYQMFTGQSFLNVFRRWREIVICDLTYLLCCYDWIFIPMSIVWSEELSPCDRVSVKCFKVIIGTKQTVQMTIFNVIFVVVGYCDNANFSIITL